MLEPHSQLHAAEPHGLLEAYRPQAGAYDEMCEASGEQRAHWDYLSRSLDALGRRVLEERRREMLRLLREDGATYNVYGSPEGTDRPWALDPIPCLFTSQEWSHIERGLLQRAELLNVILADLYGPRKLLRKGWLPPELVYAHPGFLRACSDIPIGGRSLRLYAADLGRAPDGTIWVIGDRTQAPSGAGYALENRLVVSRVLPSLFRDSQVHRLAIFFRTVRSALSAAAPWAGDRPRVVLLTPGPENEAYFEHAYLASYLGYSLVQGSDLSVRDGRVWLRTLEGLQRVDVLLRRVDDTFCDPLELRADSLLGTPGLVAAARMGTVGLVNALGSGVVENPGLIPFLSNLCQRLLGEDLILPSLATWWCGGSAEREHVLANLDKLVIKPIFPHPARCTVFGQQLSKQERESLAERIRARPHLFVGQEQALLSTAPVFCRGHIEPRAMVLRSFLAAAEEGYAVMPGGLTRVAPGTDSQMVSSQAGGVSKDTWILASEPEKRVSLLAPSGTPLRLTRTGGEVPSRVADNLFWMGRYAERSEAVARLVRYVGLMLLDPEQPAAEAHRASLLRVVTRQTATYPGFLGDASLIDQPDAELLSVVGDAARIGSLRYSLESLVQAGRSVPDRLSDDAWRLVNGLHQGLRRPANLEQAVEALEHLVTSLAAFTGLCAESMTRGQGLRFVGVGRRIERALDTLGLLLAVWGEAEAVAEPLWEAVLAATDTLTTYRRRYRGPAQAGAVLDLLLADESNPRSVAFQLVDLEREVPRLPRRGSLPHRSQEERIVMEALTALRLVDLDSLLRVPAAEAGPAGPEALLGRLIHLLHGLSKAITAAYFNHGEMPQQMVSLT